MPGQYEHVPHRSSWLLERFADYVAMFNFYIYNLLKFQVRYTDELSFTLVSYNFCKYLESEVILSCVICDFLVHKPHFKHILRISFMLHMESMKILFFCHLLWKEVIDLMKWT